MWRRLTLLFVFLCASDPLTAGAWPRGKGNHFFSTSSRVASETINGQYSVYSTFYYEYGVSDRLTIGVDFGRAVSGKSKALAYVRWPIGNLESRNRYSIELGTGVISGELVLRPGVSFGRGVKTKWGHGWMSIDSSVEYHFKNRKADIKADFSFGLDIAARLKFILQMQTGVPHGDNMFVRFAPSLVMKTTDKSHIEFGMTAGLTGDKQFGLKIGLWREF